MTARAKSKRDEILERVTELFVRNGYHGTGIQEISEAVKLGRGALYHHIGSKEQILFEISMSLLGLARESTLPYVITDDPPDVKFRNISRALLQHHAEHGDGWQVAVREARFLSAEHQSEVLDARHDFEQIWHQVLQDGARAGLWGPVNDIDVRGVLGMFNYTARWMKPDGRQSPDDIADQYVDLLLDGLRHRGKTAT
jgi:TetR/AcrR family transcriptional regulator, cholesterol catabolism regulator